MITEIRLPSITSPSTEGKVDQMQRYIFQLVQQLNYSLMTMENMEQKIKDLEDRVKALEKK